MSMKAKSRHDHPPVVTIPRAREQKKISFWKAAWEPLHNALTGFRKDYSDDPEAQMRHLIDFVTAVFAIILTAGMFLIANCLFFKTMVSDNREMVVSIVTAFTATWIMGMSYYFGSARRSLARESMLGRASAEHKAFLARVPQERRMVFFSFVSLLALVLTIAMIVIFLNVFNQPVIPNNKELLSSVVSTVMTAWVMAIAYYYGSAKSEQRLSSDELSIGAAFFVSTVACLLTVGIFGIVYVLLNKNLTDNKDLQTMFITSFTTAWIMAMSYYYGSASARQSVIGKAEAHSDDLMPKNSL